MKNPTKIRRLFQDFLILKQIKESPLGISGYQIHRSINSSIKLTLDSDNSIQPQKLSQSLIYRSLDDFQEKGIVDIDDVVVEKRLQTLFRINEKGEQHFQLLSQTIQNLIPLEVLTESTMRGLISGRINPLEMLIDKLILTKLPEEELLPSLKELQFVLRKSLERIEGRILELEKVLNK